MIFGKTTSSSCQGRITKMAMLQKGVKTKEKVSKVSIGNESVGKRGFFSRATVFSHKRLGPIGWFTFGVFLGPFDPPKKENYLSGQAQPKTRCLTFLQIDTESTQENHANVMSILLDACPCLLPQAYYTDRGACLFLGDAMTTFSFLEIHDTLALAKRGHPPTNGYLIIFNHISSASEMGPFTDTFLFSMIDIWILIVSHQNPNLTM